MIKLFMATFGLLICLSLKAQKNKSNDNKSGATSILASKTDALPLSIPQAKFKKKQQVELSVRVLSNQQADAYTAVFNLTQMAATLESAKNLLQDRFNGLMQGLQSVGVPKDAVHLEMISLKPVLSSNNSNISKTNQAIPEAFVLQQNIYVRYQNPSKLADIQFVAAQFEIYDLLKVDYQLKNQTTYLQEMQQKAIDYLLLEIELMQEKLGLDLESGYRIVAEDQQILYPNQQIKKQLSLSKLSLDRTQEKGKLPVVYQPTATFYDAVSSHEFDIVIHPERWKPSVQLMYHLQINIEVKDTQKPSKEYFWLTPDGYKVPIK
jgi:uncharacterized protein YggE